MPVLTEAEYDALHNGSDEMEHYGRLGMRWGQHIFGDEKAKEMASNKLQKLDAKAKKASEKSQKLQVKAGEKQSKAASAFLFKNSKNSKNKKAAKYSEKAYKWATRASARTRKAYEWNKTMNEVFANVKTANISKEQISIGKKYTQMKISELDLESMNAKTLLDTSLYFRSKVK